MSQRWQGHLYPRNNQQKQHLDLAGRYAALLEVLHSKCLNEPNISTEKLFHYNIITGLDISQSPAVSPQSTTTTVARDTTVDRYTAQHNPPLLWNSPSNRVSVPETELGSLQRHNSVPTRVYAGNNMNENGVSDSTESYGLANPAALGLNGTAAEDELTLMSNVLLDHQFSQMDRVITLDGTDFTWDMGVLAPWYDPA
jgi:hypothetical protein